MTELFQALTTGTSAADRAGPISKMVDAVKKAESKIIATISSIAADKIKPALSDDKNPIAREAGVEAFSALVSAFGAKAEPALTPLLPVLLERCADKVTPVRTGAEAAVSAFIASINPYSVSVVLPHLFDAMALQRNWQTKLAALNALDALAKSAPHQVARCLPDIVPKVTECFADAKEQVKTAASATATACFLVNGNRDIEQFIPALVGCIARPAETTDCIHKLAATTFVQQVRRGTALACITGNIISSNACKPACTSFELPGKHVCKPVSGWLTCYVCWCPLAGRGSPSRHHRAPAGAWSA